MEAIKCPIFYKDFYKVNHYEQYPIGTEIIFSNFTPRKSRIDGVNYSIFFGLKYFIKEYLVEQFQKNFFELPLSEVLSTYKNFMKQTLGIEKEWQHIAQLHQLGYLPIKIYALPELTKLPEKCPALVIFNTDPKFYWLTNMLETILSSILWGACTSATTANRYHEILSGYADITSDLPEFVDYQAHDFSFRGMFGLEAAMISGAAHLQYFRGTDSIPSIFFLNKYYDRDLSCGTSVPATEHSVMSAGGDLNEFDTFKRLITEIYPSGILSIVSDTWDLWNVIDNYLPRLKEDILKRNGKIVIRPDSGNPIDIICGTELQLGVIERLWNIFGGEINSKGYKQLDHHIGAIYGDSITPDICIAICEELLLKGFASTNVVFGIGSYTYQYVTRDTYGWAVKATYARINCKDVAIFKDPITDNGVKKSHKGLIKVVKENNALMVKDQITWEEFIQPDNELKLVFSNGAIFNLPSTDNISEVTDEEYLKLIKKKPKYRNVKVEYDGYKFDSKAECERYKELRSLERRGIIDKLELQIKFKLIAGINYKADFAYYNKEGRLIAEDVKGFITPTFKLKAKLFKHVYGFDITIVRK
jgi:nicotinamide phosphoribosyltransferase